MAKQSRVPRPLKKGEFAIVFATRSAEKGWRDLHATSRNTLANTWDFLTRNPTLITLENYRLRGELAQLSREGKTHDRWQHKPSATSGARIWFYVDGQTVHLEKVFTHHPNETK